MFGMKIKDPVTGQAHVLGVGVPTESQGRIMRIRLQLLIEAPGVAPQQVDTALMVKRANIPQAGMILPVTVDCGNLKKWEIDWDTAPTRHSLVDAQAQAIIDAGGIGAASRTTAPNASDDRLTLLERAAALHADGVLTDDEFAAEKARILHQHP
ncbi:MAG: SHOCT domain-containing protein [Ilumatobacteraceae bacterium]